VSVPVENVIGDCHIGPLTEHEGEIIFVDLDLS
jgi:hypothetical protein